MNQINYFKKIIKNCKWKYLLLIIFETFFYSSGFLFGGIFRRDIFNILSGQPTSTNFSIITLLILSVVVPILINILKQINTYLSTDVKQSILNNIKIDLFQSIVNKENSSSLHENRGDVINSFREDAEDIADFAMVWYNQLPRFVLSVGALIIMLNINVLYTFVSIMPMILVLVVSTIVSRKITILKTNRKKTTSKSIDFVEKMLQAVDTIKLFNITSKIVGTLNTLLVKRERATVKDVTFSAIVQSISNNAMYIVFGTIMLLFSLSINNNGFTIGDFVLFEYYFWFLSSLPTFFGTVFQKLKISTVAYNRISSYKKERNEGVNTSFNGEKFIIEFNKDTALFKKFCAQKIEVVPNTIVCFWGITGSGKSYILDSIFNNRTTDINIFDENGNSIILTPPKCVKVEQIPSFFDGTLKENICLDKTYDEHKMNEILWQVGLDSDVNILENGLETEIGTIGSKLSGGQKKRLSIARALYHDPQIIIIDDCFSGLDIITQKTLFERLLNERKYTFIISCNSSEFNDNFDKVINLSEETILCQN